jgi:hypothetical protein
MTTITIPKKITPDKELIAVPRHLYEQFLAWQEMLKSRKTFKPTATEKKAILRGHQEIAKGKYTALEELTYELASQNRRHRQKKS